MDKYDAEIERLVGLDSNELHSSWGSSRPLFEFCCDQFDASKPCGCLTMIRSETSRFAFLGGQPVPNLTEAIRRDVRLPGSDDGYWVPFFDYEWDDLPIADRRAVLNVFADWQRAMDATIRQGKPWHPEFAPTVEQTINNSVPETAACG